jgi:hypothetical protein
VERRRIAAARVRDAERSKTGGGMMRESDKGKGREKRSSRRERERERARERLGKRFGDGAFVH